VTSICLIVQDLTERVLAQETLAASEHGVRRSEALAGSGSFVVATDGSAQWSAGMYRLLDASPTDAEPSWDHYLSLVADDDRPDVESLVSGALREGLSGEVDHRAGLDGRDVWLFLSVEPLRDDAGALIGARGICLDITARKQAEDAMRVALEREQRANDELRALDSLKDDFLATVSHELRTPLTAIIGFSVLLMKKAPELAAIVEPINRTGHDMARMVETLLDYSRLQAGVIPLCPELVNLAAHVGSCFGQLPDADNTLLNDIDEDFTVVADPDALDRILGNLVGNAVRYSGSGSTVRVSAQHEDDNTVISVTDNGPGIPAEFQEHLFDRFYRVPGQNRSRGTGIGLAIVREYVTRQHGRVWCESREGGGTTFTVSLPQQRKASE
jgi:signal transduction histidine kinase